MKTLSAPSIDPRTDREVQQMLSSGVPVDAVIRAMRTAGLNKIECIKLLRTHHGLSLFEAKRAVHLSPAWADRRQADDAFHDAVSSTVNTLLVLQQDRPA